LREEPVEEEATQIASPGALVGAFSLAVSAHAPPAVADPLSLPGDEWFVGINGVPVGPIRLSELRSKASAGSITKESLVWRDGFEEWRPLRSFPELVAVVEESQSSARAALSPMAPAVGSAGIIADPFAATAPLPGMSTPGAVTGNVVVTDDLAALGLRPRHKTSPAVWIAMAVAILFGITLGFVFFGRTEQPHEIVKYVERPVQSPSPAPANQGVVDTKPGPAATPPDPKSVSKGSSGSGKAAAKPESETKLSGGLKGLGLSGLAAGGPKGPGESAATPGNAGGQLDQGQLQSAVQRYTPSVKRSCWQPQLDTRDKDAPTSARVAVSITISPSGSVQNVSTGGDPRGYRGLASCIAARVRGWQFPPSSSSTTVNVPFVFVAQ
jgi:outer membrane biosynthesis protein TonB